MTSHSRKAAEPLTEPYCKHGIRHVGTHTCDGCCLSFSRMAADELCYCGHKKSRHKRPSAKWPMKCLDCDTVKTAYHSYSRKAAETASRKGGDACKLAAVSPSAALEKPVMVAGMEITQPGLKSLVKLQQEADAALEKHNNAIGTTVLYLKGIAEERERWQARVKKHKERVFVECDDERHRCYECKKNLVNSLHTWGDKGLLCRDCAIEQDFGKVE